MYHHPDAFINTLIETRVISTAVKNAMKHSPEFRAAVARQIAGDGPKLLKRLGLGKAQASLKASLKSSVPSYA